MVIPLFLIYILCVGCFVVFLVTRRTLSDQSDGEDLRREKTLHSLNVMGFIIPIMYIPIVLFFECLIFFIGRYDDFIRDAFPVTAFFSVGFMVVFLLVVGYYMEPNRSFVPQTHQWVFLSTLLILVTGILGLVTGILI